MTPQKIKAILEDAQALSHVVPQPIGGIVSDWYRKVDPATITLLHVIVKLLERISEGEP